MKFAAVLASVALATDPTFVTVDAAGKQVLTYVTNKTYTNWVASGTLSDVEAWYQLGTTSDASGTWTLPTADKHSAESVMFVYPAVDGTTGNDVQLFWMMNYACVFATSTSVWTPLPAVVQLVKDYSANNLATSTNVVNLSTDAATSTATSKVTITAYAGVFDTGASPAITPTHSMYMQQPEETSATAVRVTISDSFTVYYQAAAYSDNAIVVTSTTLMVTADMKTGTWAAASSLTAAAATVVAATLF